MTNDTSIVRLCEVKSIIDDISLKEAIWIPGKNSYGKPVSILYTVPIQINLE